MRALVVAASLGACSFEHGAITRDAATIDAELTDALALDAPVDAPPPPLCDSSNQNLRACYTFDDNTLDGSSYGNHVTASGMSFGPGRRGSALVTTSGTAIVAGNGSLNLSALTIRVWLRPNAIPAGVARMGLVDSASRFRLFLQADGALRCALTGGADLVTQANVVGAGTWQRVTCTYSGTQMRIYVDGTMVGTLNSTSTIPSVSSGMVIGHNNPTGENFNGTVDDLQIFSAVVAP